MTGLSRNLRTWDSELRHIKRPGSGQLQNRWDLLVGDDSIDEISTSNVNHPWSVRLSKLSISWGKSQESEKDENDKIPVSDKFLGLKSLKWHATNFEHSQNSNQWSPSCQAGFPSLEITSPIDPSPSWSSGTNGRGSWVGKIFAKSRVKNLILKGVIWRSLKVKIDKTWASFPDFERFWICQKLIPSSPALMKVAAATLEHHLARLEFLLTQLPRLGYHLNFGNFKKFKNVAALSAQPTQGPWHRMADDQKSSLLWGYDMVCDYLHLELSKCLIWTPK